MKGEHKQIIGLIPIFAYYSVQRQQQWETNKEEPYN